MASSAITPDLLRSLLSPDGTIRSQAESVFHSIALENRLQGLWQCLSSQAVSNAPQPPTTLLAAVLLRRDIVKLQDASKFQELVSPLLQVFVSSSASVPDSALTQALGHCLAEIVASLSVVQANLAPLAGTQILQQIQTPCTQGHLPSLQLLARLAERAPRALCEVKVVQSLPQWNSTNPYASSQGSLVATWADVLVHVGYASNMEPNTTSSSSKFWNGALTSSPQNGDDLKVDPQSPAAQFLSPMILPILEWLVQHSSQDETSCLSTLQSLMQACATCPSLLAANPDTLEALLQMGLHIASAGRSTEIRLAALQLLSSLVRVTQVKRACLTPAQGTTLATTALPLCAQLLEQAKAESSLDDSEWAQEAPSLMHPEDDDHDEDNDASFALYLMGEFIQTLGAVSVVLPLAERALGSASTATLGLQILQVALEAAPVSMVPHICVVWQAGLNFATSSSSLRTRYQALRLLGSLAEEEAHAQQIATQQLPRLWQVLGQAMQESKCPKLVALACLVLVSACRCSVWLSPEDGTSHVLAPHVAEVFQVLQGPLSSSDPVAVQVRAVGAVAVLAQACSGDVFAPYYPQILPGLLQLVSQSQQDVAAAALEAATIIGQVVGRDQFASDAHSLLQWMVPHMQNMSNAMLEPMLLACARIASVLEEDFTPYAQHVVPLLLQRLQQEPEVSIVEGDESGLAGSSGEDDWAESMTVALPGRGFTKVSINTSKIQEQAQSARALYEHAKGMGASFASYVQPCFDVLLPLVSFPYSADVRSTCSQTLSAVYDAACLAGVEQGMRLPRLYLPQIVKTIAHRISSEDTADREALYAFADSLSEVFYITYRYRKSHPELLQNYSMTDAEEVVGYCIRSLVSCLERREKFTQILQGSMTGEDEKQEYLNQLQAEEQLLTPLVDSIGYNLKFFGANFVPLFEKQVSPVLGPKLEEMSDIRATLSSVCLFDDTVEHCGSDAAARYAPSLLPAILNVFEKHSEEKELVQAAVYGIAQIARYAPNTILSSHLPTLVHNLVSLASRSKEEFPDDLYLIEISTSALASLTLLGPFPDLKFAPRADLVDTFLKQLPILQDDDEAKICHAGFCHLVENGTVSLEQEACRIIRIIGEILVEVQDGEDLACPDTVERLSSILFRLQQGVPPATFHQAVGALGPEVQHMLGTVLHQIGASHSRVVTP